MLRVMKQKVEYQISDCRAEPEKLPYTVCVCSSYCMEQMSFYVLKPLEYFCFIVLLVEAHNPNGNSR